MSAITWSLNDERSDIFDGWGVVRGRLFELGDRDMSGINLFSVEETQKRRIKDLNRELLHVRNLAEKLREENEKLKAEVVGLKGSLRQAESKSLMAMIHGTCECGTAWSPIVSDKEGFSLLHCFSCGNNRYENIEVFGNYNPEALRGES